MGDVYLLQTTNDSTMVRSFTGRDTPAVVEKAKPRSKSPKRGDNKKPELNNNQVVQTFLQRGFEVCFQGIAWFLQVIAHFVYKCIHFIWPVMVAYAILAIVAWMMHSSEYNIKYKISKIVVDTCDQNPVVEGAHDLISCFNARIFVGKPVILWCIFRFFDVMAGTPIHDLWQSIRMHYGDINMLKNAINLGVEIWKLVKGK